MPSNGTIYYQYVTPVNVGAAISPLPASDPGYAQDAQDYRAVNFGVKAIQTRINEMGFANPNNSALTVDGFFGTRTAWGIGWAQGKLGVGVDGQAGPITLKSMLWPVIKALPYNSTILHVVGGICQHESGYDPGAVGEPDPHDIGLVQINGPANPSLSEAQRFDYHVAFKYAADRIAAALGTPGYTLDAAIASYGYPSVAAYWVKSGTETFPTNLALNQLALDYVHYIRNWVSPS